jgi:CBS-domain-containing membrane protein
MKKFIFKSAEDFRKHWKNYLYQSFLAWLALFVTLLVLNVKESPILVASIGATVFIVFAIPKSITAKPRNMIGGYIVGILTGLTFSLFDAGSPYVSYIQYSAAVALSIFIMVLTDTEHPPASGLALGFAIYGFLPRSIFVVMISVMIMSLAHNILEPHLKDLT